MCFIEINTLATLQKILSRSLTNPMSRIAKFIAVTFFALASVVMQAEPVRPLKQPATNTVDFPETEIRAIITEVAKLFALKVAIPEQLTGHTSVKLRDVTWQQLYKVILQPIGYEFIERGSAVTVLRNEEVDALPPDKNVVEILFQQPQSLADYIRKIYVDRVKLEVLAEELIVVTNPRYTQMVLNEIERLDSPRERLDPFPRKVYFPEKIPAQPLQSEAEWMPQKQPEIMETQIIIVQWIDAYAATSVVKREFPDLSKVVPDRRSNALVVTCTPLQFRKVQALVKYLDDKKWYTRPEKKAL